MYFQSSLRITAKWFILFQSVSFLHEQLSTAKMEKQDLKIFFTQLFSLGSSFLNLGLAETQTFEHLQG